MIEKIGSLNVKLLGDPHLGRSFLNGTPLHRRGDREKMQWVDFEKSLMEVQGVNVHVCMGDLFDKWSVPYTVIYRAAMAYNRAATENPRVRYVVLMGNHDASRDLERISAFKLFSHMLNAKNIAIVDQKPYHWCWEDRSKSDVVLQLSFIPWHPVLTADEVVEKDVAIRNADAVFGHWDVVEAFGGDNYIPAKRLHELGVKRAITGHDHHKRSMTVDELPVLITGSMQPYSHAEDHDGDFYVTVGKLELENLRPEFLKNRNVRVLLQPGESIDQIPDCLNFKTQRVGAPEEDDQPIDVEFTGFSFQQVFDEVMAELNVDPSFAAKASEKYDAERAKQ